MYEAPKQDDFIVFQSAPRSEAYVFDPRRGTNYDDYAVANGLLRKPTFNELKAAFMCGDPRLDGPPSESYIYDPRRGGNYNSLGGNTFKQLESAYIDTASGCSSLACARARRDNLTLGISMLLTEAEAVLEDSAPPEA